MRIFTQAIARRSAGDRYFDIAGPPTRIRPESLVATLRWVLVVVALVIGAGTATAPMNAAEPGDSSPRPLPIRSSVTAVQPMTGIVLWSENPAAAEHRDAIAMEYRYCGYHEAVNQRGEFDFTRIDRILDEIASRNHQAILRFYFCYVGKPTTVPEFLLNQADYRETVGLSEGEKTHFCDWSNPALQQFTLDFYKEFARRYDRDRRIAFLQTGFGLWAEYHIYSGPFELGRTFPSHDFQARFLRHLDRVFTELPWSVSVDAADDEVCPLVANPALRRLGFGVFDDSFLCKPHAKENALNWAALGVRPAPPGAKPKRSGTKPFPRWHTHPGGGEFSYYNRRDQREALDPGDGPNGVTFETSAAKFHVSYMIGNDQPQHAGIARIRSASRATGYRFRVVQASIRGREVRLRVTNDGVAPIYRDAYFTVGGRRSDVSLKGLLPGEFRVVAVTGIDSPDTAQIQIESDAILPGQAIQFDADLGL